MKKQPTTSQLPRPRLLTLPQAMEYLNVSEDQIRAWRKRGTIPTRKVGKSLRFCPVELEQWTRGEWTATLQPHKT